MLKYSLCDYNDAHIPVTGAITITGAEDDAAARWVVERKKRSNV